MGLREIKTQGRQMLLNDEPLHLRGVLDQGYFPAGWCAQRAFVEAMVSLTQALDPTRPVVGNDGWEFSRGDLWTLHL